VSELHHLERPADGTPEGLLVLHHGRGSDEHDLLPLADILDPDRRLHVVTPQAPLTLPGAPGRHWYAVPRIGYPDPASFAASLGALTTLHAALQERLGIAPEKTILGGFSQGTVMSYAAGLAPGTPAPAAILALSGFIPSVLGWAPALDERPDTRVYIAHGTRDPVIDVAFARQARATLEPALELEYHEFGGGHHIDPRQLPAMADWIADAVP
jgi:phospholipase/carboxylesterase